ncbi:MAG TPA: 4Fe-4S dicluster domain-containing protein [Cyclobacteriaceae bacterium]|nr:4Fe-4S dicluster domain-containing protein [Cyclobacteriaceae bacterium]
MSIRQSYWGKIHYTIGSLLSGLRITFRHLVGATKTQSLLSIDNPKYFDNRLGVATIQYPHEILPVPETGRYRLHNEIDDCIVCDKCVKICPVNCITIDPIRATEEIGKTSDGTPKRIYAATFDIDMGKCCYCGLCTTVCPTECLTMTKVYDFSVFDIREHNYSFAEMTPSEIVEKKKLFEESQKAKAQNTIAEEKKTDTKEGGTNVEAPKASPRPVFKPKIKPPQPPKS